MAANLGLVVDAAQRHAHELAPERARDGVAQRGLANAGRPDEAENRLAAGRRARPGSAGLAALPVLLELAHREVLEDAVLDLLQVVVVLVEHGARVGDVDLLAGTDIPGQRDQQLDIRADDRVLRRDRRNLLQPRKLAQGVLIGLFGHVRLLDLLAQLVDGRGLFVLLAQLLLDGFQLLAQNVLALRLAHLLLGLALNLLAQFQHFQLVCQEVDDQFQLAPRRLDLQDLLAQSQVHLRAAGDEIDDLQRILQVEGGHRQLVGKILDEVDEPLEEVVGGALERLQLDAHLLHVRRGMRFRAQIRLLPDPLVDLEALQPLHDDLHRSIRNAQQARDAGDGADAEDIAWPRLLDARIFLRDEAHQPVAAHDVVDQIDRALLADAKGHQGEGVDNGVLERQNG